MGLLSHLVASIFFVGISFALLFGLFRFLSTTVFDVILQLINGFKGWLLTKVTLEDLFLSLKELEDLSFQRHILEEGKRLLLHRFYDLCLEDLETLVKEILIFFKLKLEDDLELSFEHGEILVVLGISLECEEALLHFFRITLNVDHLEAVVRGQEHMFLRVFRGIEALVANETEESVRVLIEVIFLKLRHPLLIVLVLGGRGLTVRVRVLEVPHHLALAFGRSIWRDWGLLHLRDLGLFFFLVGLRFLCFLLLENFGTIQLHLLAELIIEELFLLLKLVVLNIELIEWTLVGAGHT